MAITEQLQELAASVQALFAQQRGVFSPADFSAVAELLGFDARPHLPPLAPPQPLAGNALADLVGVNLAYALATFAWGAWRPLTEDGVTIAGFWDPTNTPAPPAGYALDASGRYLQPAL